MSQPDDNHLGVHFAGLSRGKLDALEALFGQWQRALCNYAYGLTRNEGDAEDAVAEAMLGLVRQGARLRAVRNPKAYLFAAVRHAAYRSLKAPRLHAAPASVEPEAEQQDAAEALAVKEALMSLPDEQREAVTLKVHGQLTFAEIAQVTDVPLNTAASRYRYGIDKLRQILGEPSDG